MAIGKIIQLKNNYGFIETSSYKMENEWIPFQVNNEMLVKSNGKELIKYTIEVEFDLTPSQGIRDRDIKEATNIKFIGYEWKYKERNFEEEFCEIVRNRFDKFAFYYPEVTNEEFIKWLEKNNFQPRMLEYLSAGVFNEKEILKKELNQTIESKDEKFKIMLLFAIDRIDVEFRKKILSWIVGIENSFKSYFAKICISKEGKIIWENVISKWSSKKPKVKKLVKRARNKRKFRVESDEFNYLMNENAVPILDFTEQLELNELTELIDMFYKEYLDRNNIPDILKKMKECISFIKDLCVLRNAAAHGRAILPAFMDPDYNGNWDLEFDNIEKRSNVDNWILYDLLKEKWHKLGQGEYSKEIINTIYGNPLRRAWIELNYMYFYIVTDIEKTTFELFIAEAHYFLSKDIDMYNQTKNVNLLNLRLSDMGNTTMGVSAPPYDEIAQEAYAIWELFEK